MTADLTIAETEPRQRSVRIDLVRLLGLAVVVAGHVWTQYPIGGYVAIFFVLAGYLHSARRSLAAEVRYQTWKLLIPYAGWLLLLAVPYFARLVLGTGGTVDLADRGLDLLWGGERATRPFTAFWFMTAMFIAAVLFRAVVTLPRVLYLGCLGAALAASVFDQQILGDRPGAADVGAVAILFMAAGHAYRAVEPRLGRAYPAALVVIAGCALLVATGTSARLTLKAADFGTPVLSIGVAVLIALAALSLATPLTRSLSVRASRTVTAVVRMGTPIILLHAVPLWLLPESVPQTVKFVAALAFPICVALALLRYPDSVARRALMPDKDHHLL